MALAALAAVGAMLFAGSANAAPMHGFQSLDQAASPAETVGYYKRYRRNYVPDYYVNGYAPNYKSYSYRNHNGGNYEIKELQRLFPETNWPPSMRYHQY
jgi:hypothetical protein